MMLATMISGVDVSCGMTGRLARAPGGDQVGQAFGVGQHATQQRVAAGRAQRADTQLGVASRASVRLPGARS